MPQTGELPRAAPILWALLRIFISAHLLCRVAEAERSLLLLLLLPLYFLLPQRLKQTKRRTAPVTANRLTAPFLHPALPTVVPWTSDWRAPHEFPRFTVSTSRAAQGHSSQATPLALAPCGSRRQWRASYMKTRRWPSSSRVRATLHCTALHCTAPHCTRHESAVTDCLARPRERRALCAAVARDIDLLRRTRLCPAWALAAAVEDQRPIAPAPAHPGKPPRLGRAHPPGMLSTSLLRHYYSLPPPLP